MNHAFVVVEKNISVVAVENSKISVLTACPYKRTGCLLQLES